MISEWLKKENPHSEWFEVEEGERTGNFSGLNAIGGDSDPEDDEEEDDVWGNPDNWPQHEGDSFLWDIELDSFDDLQNAGTNLIRNFADAESDVSNLIYGWTSADNYDPVWWNYPPMVYGMDSGFAEDLIARLDDPDLDYDELVNAAFSFGILALYETDAMDVGEDKGPVLSLWEQISDGSLGLSAFLKAAGATFEDKTNLNSWARGSYGSEKEFIQNYITMNPDPRLLEGEYSPITKPTIADEEPSLDWRPGQAEVELPQLQAIRQAVVDWDLDAMIQIMDSILPTLPPTDPIRSSLIKAYRAMIVQNDTIINPDGARYRSDVGSVQYQVLQDIDAKIKAQRGRNDASWRSNLFGENQLTLARVQWSRESATVQDIDQSYMMLVQDVTDDLYAIQSSARIGAWDQAEAEFEQIIDTLRNLASDVLSDDMVFLLRELRSSIRDEDLDDILKLTPELLYVFEGTRSRYEYQQG